MFSLVVIERYLKKGFVKNEILPSCNLISEMSGTSKSIGSSGGGGGGGVGSLGGGGARAFLTSTTRPINC